MRKTEMSPITAEGISRVTECRHQPGPKYNTTAATQAGEMLHPRDEKKDCHRALNISFWTVEVTVVLWYYYSQLIFLSQGNLCQQKRKKTATCERQGWSKKLKDEVKTGE